MNDVGGRLDPAAVGVDVGEDLDGADDGVGGDLDAAGVLDDVGEGLADVAVAAFEQAGGVGVAVEGAAVEAVIVGDLADAFPVDESLVDFVAELVRADAALGLVELEKRFPLLIPGLSWGFLARGWFEAGRHHLVGHGGLAFGECWRGVVVRRVMLRTFGQLLPCCFSFGLKAPE